MCQSANYKIRFCLKVLDESATKNSKSSALLDHQCNITIEAVSKMQFSRTCKGMACSAECQLKKRTFTSRDTTSSHSGSSNSCESVRVYADTDDVSDDETDDKCRKWVEDVNTEKEQNPGKMFLPHLLIP